jgi:hypothetical protein
MAADLSREIAAFYAQRLRLLSEYGAQWVVFVMDECKGHFDAFEDAARFALDNFGDQRFLIRRTDDPQPQIPMLFVEA